MATLIDIGTLIEQTPGIRGGRPCVAGTGVSVLRIAGWYKLDGRPRRFPVGSGISPWPRFMQR
jgi:uncharacterized protein (DUF433 family)